MNLIAFVLRLILTATFAVAGLAKLNNLEQSRQAVRDFGLPAWSAKPLGLLLPMVELAVAVALIPIASLPWGVFGAAALLLAFTVAIGVNLSLGRKPSCNCFGQIHSEPIGWPTLARNGVLLFFAGVIGWDWRRGGSVSLLGWLTGLSRLDVVILVLVVSALLLLAAAVWVVFHLLRQNGRLLLRMDALEAQVAGNPALPGKAQSKAGPPLQSRAPYFALPAMDGGETVTLHHLLAKKRPVALIFSDPNCGPCSVLLPQIANWQKQYPALSFAVISRGSVEANKAKLRDVALEPVLLQKDREVAIAYSANATPAAIVIGTDGRIATSLAMGSEAIEAMVGQAHVQEARAIAAARQEATRRLSHGDPAPITRLTDLDGRMIDLATQAQPTLLLFWNPGCGFCSSMLKDLQRWEQLRSPEMAQLLIVSSGSVDQNRGLDLRFPIIIDTGFAIGQSFGVRGTPSAVLVDEQGMIVSDVVAGAPAVLDLATTAGRIPLFSEVGYQ